MGKFLYLEAKRKIVEMIQGGDFGSNDKILSERELADILGYSRMTVKKAIGSLVEDGVLYKKRGAGTFCPMRDIPIVLRLETSRRYL